jgi:transposase
MHRINLSPPEQTALESTFKTTPDRRLRDRCQAVRMASRGRKRTEMAQDVGLHRSTIMLWLKRDHKRGLSGLQSQWAPGKTRRMPEDLAPTIQEWVKKGPQSCALDRANWTYEELAVYLYQQTGIDVKRSAMQDFCQHHQIRPYRPTYQYLRGDPQKQQIAREEIAALKKSRTRPGRAAQSR